MCAHCWRQFRLRLREGVVTRRTPCFVQSLWSWDRSNEDVSRALVYALKGCRESARWLPLAALFVESSFLFAEKSCLVPIPSKKNPEGDHALGFAKALGELTGLPVERCLVAEAAPSQKALTKSERRRVRFRKIGRLKKSAQVVLVDDVVTSGATLAAAKAALNRREPLQAWCLMDRRLVADF
jgi:predicted amidophosphoribosyltransferase